MIRIRRVNLSAEKLAPGEMMVVLRNPSSTFVTAYCDPTKDKAKADALLLEVRENYTHRAEIFIAAS